MTSSSTVLDHLMRALPPQTAAQISCDGPVLLAHTCQGVAPYAVASPRNEAQAVEILRAARELRLQVVPYGSGTGQGIGSPPQENALVISTAAMNALIQHEPGDMVATVQAGIMLSALQQQLAAKGQFLPLDGPPRATVGGMIATDRHGPRAIGYGTLRDMVLGMTVINGDGVARKCGGRVVKNVTGYDLAKLYIGSMGTLGLVTEVTFKLRPLPIATRFWGLHAASMKDALERLAAIHARNLPLEALTIHFTRDTKPQCGIAVLASGSNAELERIGRELGLDSNSTVVDGARAIGAALDPWQNLQEVDHEPAARLRFHALPSKVATAWNQLAEAAQAATLSMYGGWVVLETDSKKTQRVIDEVAAAGFHARVEASRGISIERPFGPARPEFALMKKIRAALDPAGIMNSSRFVV